MRRVTTVPSNKQDPGISRKILEEKKIFQTFISPLFLDRKIHWSNIKRLQKNRVIIWTNVQCKIEPNNGEKNRECKSSIEHPKFKCISST